MMALTRLRTLNNGVAMSSITSKEVFTYQLVTDGSADSADDDH